MSDFNKEIKIVVTVIERTQAKAFFLHNIDCPFDCELEEFHSILQDVLTCADFEKIVNDERKRRSQYK